jgi:hypothetical protein
VVCWIDVAPDSRGDVDGRTQDRAARSQEPVPPLRDDAPSGRGDASGRERFAVRGLLGQGGMGRVYRAYDQVRGQEVALKLLTSLRPESLYAFKREFRALSGLVHPNLVTLYGLYAWGEEWALAMELVQEPCTLLEHVRPFRHLLPAAPGSGAPDPEIDGATRTALSELAGSSAFADSAIDERTRTSIGLLDSAASGTAAAAPGAAAPVAQDPHGAEGAPVLTPRRAALIAASVLPERVGAAFTQLAQALVALHGAGMLHRDLKPSNVLVDRVGRVVVCDFGLVAPSDGSTAGFAGTPVYASPEQLTGAPLGAASDWYAVGVMLYEALTGRLPFETGSVAELRARKQAGNPVPPVLLDPGVPPALSALCTALLAPEPQHRPSPREVIAALGQGGEATSQSDLRRERALPFVGRRAELLALEAAFADTRRGRTTTVLVGAPSGAGKSALVTQAVARLAEQHGALVLSGRCYETESVPFKALDAVVDALATYLYGLPDGGAEVIAPGMDALAALFPTLQRSAAVAAQLAATGRRAGEHGMRGRAAQALRATLCRIARTRPVVLVLDDLQWGDDDSAPFLSELAQASEVPGLLIAATYRNDGATAPPLVAALQAQLGLAGAGSDVRSLALAPLDSGEITDLVCTVLEREDAGELADEIAREAGGNPFFAIELTLARVEQRAAAADLDTLLAQRSRALPREARRLLKVVALAARPQPVTVLARAAQVRDLERTLALLRAGRFTRSEHGRAGELLTTYHDRVGMDQIPGLEAYS